MPPSTVEVELIAATPLTHTVREFRFRPLQPSVVDFQAGQYVNIVVEPATADRPAVTRAYSLCTPPQQRDYLGIVANLVPGGKGSAYLFQLPIGAHVQLRGPTGHFLLDPRGVRDYYFVATGTGIGPIRAMIESLLATGTTRAVTLLWGLRSQRDLYFQAELAALAQQHPNFTYTVTLSQPEPGWVGEVGRVTQQLPRRIRSVDTLDFYLCGRGEMIQEVKSWLKTVGLCPVHTEKFY